MIWSFFVEVVFPCKSRSIGIWVITRFTQYLLGLELTQNYGLSQLNPEHHFYRQQRVSLDKRSQLWKKSPSFAGCMSK